MEVIMVQKIISNNDKLAKKIKFRRNELGLTIEEAAYRAGVGTKTWSRYESGGDIRSDKCKGICKALNWRDLPGQDEEITNGININKYKKHIAWSKFLKDGFGDVAALSFAVGSDIILDYIEEDLNALSSLPLGAHIGQLAMSMLEDYLPGQFLVRYDYEFLYKLKCVLNLMRARAKDGLPMYANSVAEELLVYICNQEAAVFIELSGGIVDENEDAYLDYDEWVYDLFGDADIITFLYDEAIYVDNENVYHFSHWFDKQFYMS